MVQDFPSADGKKLRGTASRTPMTPSDTDEPAGYSVEYEELGSIETFPGDALLGGSWVVIIGMISRVTKL